MIETKIKEEKEKNEELKRQNEKYKKRIKKFEQSQKDISTNSSININTTNNNQTTNFIIKQNNIEINNSNSKK